MIKKNTLHVINTFFSLAYFGNQFKYFSEKGYKQFLICSPSKNLKEYSEFQQIDYLELNISRKISVLNDIKVIYKTCKYIKKNNIEIVVGHTPKGALIAMISGFIMRVPKRIYFRHGLIYPSMKGINFFLFKNIERFTALLSTKIINVSNYLSNTAIEEKLNPSYKQVVLNKGTCGGIDTKFKFNPNRIDSLKIKSLKNRLNISDEDFVIGFCGRLSKDKGIETLVKSFLVLAKTNENYRLLLVGDVDERDPLNNDIIYQIENNKKIIKTGFIFDNIEYYYALMDVFVFPSIREGFGMSIIEASAMQLPVLTTGNTGSRDAIINGITGFYIEPNVNSIISNLKKVKKNMGIKGREYTQKYFDNSILWPIIEKEIYKK